MRRDDTGSTVRDGHKCQGKSCLRGSLRVVLGLAAAIALSGCSEQITKHGHQFHETDLQAIQPGMSQPQVKATLGTPATSAVVGNGNAYYYISSTMSQSAFFTPLSLIHI